MTPPPWIVKPWTLATLTAAFVFLVGCGPNEPPISPTVQTPIPPGKELNKLDPFNPPTGKKGGLSGN